MRPRVQELGLFTGTWTSISGVSNLDAVVLLLVSVRHCCIRGCGKKLAIPIVSLQLSKTAVVIIGTIFQPIDYLTLQHLMGTRYAPKKPPIKHGTFLNLKVKTWHPTSRPDLFRKFVFCLDSGWKGAWKPQLAGWSKSRRQFWRGSRFVTTSRSLALRTGQAGLGHWDFENR